MNNKSQVSLRQNRGDRATGLVIKSIYESSFSQNQMSIAWNTQVKRQFTKECHMECRHRGSDRAEPRLHRIQTGTPHELKWYAGG